MARKWFALAAFVLVLVSVNGCAHRRERPGLLARIRGQSAAPHSEPYYPSTMMPSHPMVMPNGGAGPGSCCNGGSPMMIPNTGPGIMPGVTEQFPGAYPGINPNPYPGINPNPTAPAAPSGPGEAKPLPAGPSGDMMKAGRPGRVTNMPEVK